MAIAVFRDALPSFLPLQGEARRGMVFDSYAFEENHPHPHPPLEKEGIYRAILLAYTLFIENRLASLVLAIV
jgi:hypothetical protein